jgi:uncharacterized phage infection (PIP) family protein YhgE
LVSGDQIRALILVTRYQNRGWTGACRHHQGGTTRARTDSAASRQRNGNARTITGMAKSSRVPSAVGSIPVVGDLVKQADSQAQWLQELVEQNARLVSQLPATIKTLNDSLERFNESVARLDRMVTRMEKTSERVRDLPALADAIRKEALPALRAATDTQRQVALLQGTVERIATVLSELPGAGLLRRLAGQGQAQGPAPTSRTGDDSQ